jgi:ATP-dependent helicase/DNAse subunit B
VTRDLPALRAQARTIAERALQNRDHESLSRLQHRDVLSSVLAHVEAALADDEWVFEAAEVSLTAGKAYEPVEIAFGAQALALTGRLDRVDAARDGKRLRVVDYKRSTVPEKRHLGTMHHQVAIYMRALANTGKESEGAYFSKTKARAIHAKDGPETTERSLAAITEALRAVEAGHIAPRPVLPEVCISCEFDGVCRKPRFAVEEDE